jgi:hypothetical protein
MIVGHRAQNHPQQTALRGALDDVDDRRTPPDLLRECADLAGVEAFTLDAAATAANTVTERFCTDGLTQPWSGIVWVNPPYSDCGVWVRRAHGQAPDCDTIAMLLPANRTEQRWWQESVEPYRLSGRLDVRFLAKRRRFDRPGWTKPAKGDRPPFGLVLLVWHGRALVDDELQHCREAHVCIRRRA